jgi:hypothetical protein
MADKKISALPGASTPLAGTEVLPIVQGGDTVKVAVSNLTAGRAISATQLTLTTGNLIVISGKGVDFSATPGAGTSELFADYEEGTWTPTDASVAGLTLTSASGSYTKSGRAVICQGLITYPVTVDPAAVQIGGLPFGASGLGGIGGTGFNSAGFQLFMRTNSPSVILPVNSANANTTNASVSGATIIFQFIYNA